MRKKKSRKRGCVIAAALALAVTGVLAYRLKKQQKSADSMAEAVTEAPSETPYVKTEGDEIREEIAEMTLEEKVGQLFIVSPDTLVGYTAIQVGDDLKAAIQTYQPSGLIYFADNLTDPDQTETMIADTKQVYAEAGLPVPFISVDEEGGSVARIGNNPAFQVETFPDMKYIGQEGDVSKASYAGTTIGTYLHQLGFNMDFAPVADVLTNPYNTVVSERSFGSDPVLVTEMAQAVSDGLMEQNVISVWKHYPGHGATSEDSHTSAAYTEKTLEEMKQAELIPFAEGNAPVIMAGHISCPNVTGDNTPASLSKVMITDVLREELGYDGVVITDSLSMQAIADSYTSAEAAVKALEAGVDLLLMPADFPSAFQGVIDAVNNGTLSEERIDASLMRIMKLKRQIS